ncbi:hypothetical protein JAAARDRAFT_596440 [Jaapia argillacea MUCL 33604]|uniref:F-box domain-containing protein n=1 Tax=Jaapia argillacea MUCL 33604 TaxID=933084 RepID=A0A067PZI4_9AGAM|nr:hypothetical protein JAAARDRAFT_596440 [Jaapia argillacea MUCL 33604]
MIPIGEVQVFRPGIPRYQATDSKSNDIKDNTVDSLITLSLHQSSSHQGCSDPRDKRSAHLTQALQASSPPLDFLGYHTSLTTQLHSPSFPSFMNTSPTTKGLLGSRLTEGAIKGITALPVELHTYILLSLPFPGLLSSYRAYSLWRSLIPTIIDPDRLHLLNLAFLPHKLDPYPHPIISSVRKDYVHYIETKYGIEIPHEYRLVLTEWPFSHPPLNMTWPDALRFFADPDKGCSCNCRRNRSFRCTCQDVEVGNQWIRVSDRLLEKVYGSEEFDLFHDPLDDM